MATDAAHILNLISQEDSDRFQALVRVLGKLKYRVHLSSPSELTFDADGPPNLVYLGARSWASGPLERLKVGDPDHSQLLALERAAFRWAKPAIRNSGDFLTWPCPQSELKLRLERSYPSPSDGRAQTMARRLERSAPVRALGLVGQSSVFLDSLLPLRRFALCDASVLLHGETGTGKELAARAIHRLSRRRDGPFVPVCCGALPDSLVEAEFFGHARGAFTDARDARPGLVGQAEKGTLFLDEVEALSARGQAALLRFLESLEYRRIGGNRLRTADLRVIAAGNEDLHAQTRHGAFRSDLLYRLNVLSLTLPPLRARIGDAEILADHFLSRFAERYETGPLILNAASRRWLASYGWPGNVRELENVVHRAVVTAPGPHIELGPEPITPEVGTFAQPFGEAKRTVVEAFERDYLTRLMKDAGGNVTQAAAQAGKERRALGKLLKKHGIVPASFHDAGSYEID
jgi:DNA-binding NtrC family response regulator